MRQDAGKEAVYVNRKAVVAGATGLVGQALVRKLLDDPAYAQVTVLARRPVGMQHSKLMEKVVSFDKLEKTDIDVAGSDVFSVLGTTRKKSKNEQDYRRVEYDYPLILGRIAKKQGANQFIAITSIGADPSSRFLYPRVKGEIEEALRALGLPALHIFRPSLLLGKRNEFRFFESLAAHLSKIVSPLFSLAWRKYKPVHADTVAEALIQAAKSGRTGVHIYENDQIWQGKLF